MRAEAARFTWWLVLPAAGWLVVAAVGYWPTRSLAGPAAVTSMLLAQGLVFGATWITLLPVAGRLLTVDEPTRLALMLRSAGQRFAVTVLIAGLMAWRWGSSARVFLVWVAISYVAATMGEAIVLTWWLRKLKRQACA